MSGSIPTPGKYAVVVHYYQPNHVMFPSRVTLTSDQAAQGSMRFKYCPHASGCRSVVKNNAGDVFFEFGGPDVALEVAIPQNASAWIVSRHAIASG